MSETGSVGIVQKQVFELPRYRTVGGASLSDLRIGYQTYGRLSPRRDNTILVCHHFSGTSHVAGRYAPDDPEPGFWDGIIGPGKALDTERYFIIATDTLCNLDVGPAGTAVSTGPASIDPATGRPYGMRFPLLVTEDFVHVQRALLEGLGIGRLAAVAGPSGGSIQSLVWGVTYPERMRRIIAVIPPGLALPAYSVAQFDTWCAPIRLDPAWNGGDYYAGPRPEQGLRRALELITLNALHFDILEQGIGRAWGEPGRDPASSWQARYRVQDQIAEIAAQRAAAIDPNALLYMAKAFQQYDIRDRLERLQAPVLLMPAASDVILPPLLAEQALRQLKAAGRAAELVTIPGNGGHLDGLNRIAEVQEAIRDFLV